MDCVTSSLESNTEAPHLFATAHGVPNPDSPLAPSCGIH